MQLQVIDADYVMINDKPTMRLFCKDLKGQSWCVFYDKYLPYFYLYASPDSFEEASSSLKKKYPEIKTEVVEKTLPLGYQKPTKVLKITGRDPSKVPEMREYAAQWGEPYEADILFKYRFMVDHGLRGMGWIEVDGRPLQTKTVKCGAIEATSIKPIELVKNAPLKYLSFDIECLPPMDRMVEADKDPIILIGLTFSHEYKGKNQLCLVAKSAKSGLSFSNEKEMLEKFKDIIIDYDPDVLVGYNIENFDIPYILERMRLADIRLDIGRSEKSAYTKQIGIKNRSTIVGRMVMDPFYVIKYLSVYDQPLRFRRFDLDTVSKQIFGEGKTPLGESIVAFTNSAWRGDLDKMNKLIEYCLRDSELALRMVLSHKLIDMDKFIEMAKLSGLVISDLMSGQAARHENALLHELSRRNMLLPRKPERKNFGEDSEDTKLIGATVLEPVVGLHNEGYVLVLDFKSMYPSLIMHYNICPTTLMKFGDFDCETSPIGAKFVKKSVREGIFPYVSRYYFEQRFKVKKEMKMEKDPEVRRILDAKQYALKGMLVSLWGYIGFAAARFFVPEVAGSITGWGRQSIEKARGMIEENFGYKVVYGDTDSLFIETDIRDLDLALKKGQEMAGFVNERLTGLEMEFEKAFKAFLILTKKRYAALGYQLEGGEWREKTEMKGIETVRRDWCRLVSETQEEVLNVILKEGNVQKAVEIVRREVERLQRGETDLQKLAITKSLTKKADSYDGMQPHVELAKKMKQRSPQDAPTVGDRISFVILSGNQQLSKRTEDVEYAKEKGLRVDPIYYTENQLLPPIERIMSVLGVDKGQLLGKGRQYNLHEMINGNGKKIRDPISDPKRTVVSNLEGFVCSTCSTNFRRTPLSGRCDCGGEIFAQGSGTMGKIAVI